MIRNWVHQKQKGQVALFAAIFFLVISVVVGTSITALGASQLNVANEFVLGKKSFATAESGLEDMALRMADQQAYVHDATETVTISGQGSAAVTSSSANGSYSVTTVGNVSNRFRELSASFTLANQSGIGFPAALAGGYLGVTIDNSMRVENANEPTSHGNIFANSSVLGPGTSDYVSGEIRTIRPTGADPAFAQMNTDISGTPQLIRNMASRRDGAQSFIASKTAYATEAWLHISRNTNSLSNIPDLNVVILPNDSATGYPKNLSSHNAYRYNFSASNVPYCNMSDSSWLNTQNPRPTQCPDLNGPWTVVRLNSNRPLYENEKYWLIVDLSGTGYAYNYSLSAGTDTSYTPSGTCYDKTWCNTPTGNTYVPWTQTNAGTFMTAPDYSAASPTWTMGNTDVAFKVFFGEPTYVNQADPYNTANPYIVKAENVQTGGAIRAYAISDSIVGDNTSISDRKAYYRYALNSVTAAGLPCTNSTSTNCVYGTQALEPFDLVDLSSGDYWQQYINEFKKMASSGGTTTGSVTIATGTTYYSGPRVINGDLTLNGSGKLVIKGDQDPSTTSSYVARVGGCPYNGSKCYVVWVKGKLVLNNTCSVDVGDPNATAYLIVTGGKVTAGDSCTFNGNGGNVVVVDTYYIPDTGVNTEPQNTMNFQNTVTGDAVLFVPMGEVRLANNTNISAISAARITAVNTGYVRYKDTLITPASPGDDLVRVPSFSAYYQSN